MHHHTQTEEANITAFSLLNRDQGLPQDSVQVLITNDHLTYEIKIFCHSSSNKCFWYGDRMLIY